MGIELAGHTDAREAGVGDQAQNFTATIFDHRQDAELARGAKAVGQEVERSRRPVAVCLQTARGGRALGCAASGMGVREPLHLICPATASNVVPPSRKTVPVSGIARTARTASGTRVVSETRARAA